MKLHVEFADGIVVFEDMTEWSVEEEFVAMMEKLGYYVQGDCYTEGAFTLYYEADLSYCATEIENFAHDKGMKFQGVRLSKGEKPSMEVNYGLNTVTFFDLDDDCKEAEDFMDMMEMIGFRECGDGVNRGFRLYEFRDPIDDLDFTFRCFAHEHNLSFFRTT